MFKELSIQACPKNFYTPKININEDEDENRDENGFPFFGGNKNFNQNIGNIEKSIPSDVEYIVCSCDS